MVTYVEVKLLLFQGLQTGVDFINKYLTLILKGFDDWFLLAVAIALGYLLKTKIDDDKFLLYYWVLFSLLIYMAMKYIGLGG